MAAILPQSQCVKGHLFYSNSERAVIEYRHHVFYKRPPDIAKWKEGTGKLKFYDIFHMVYTLLSLLVFFETNLVHSRALVILHV